jgi:hypothetical protein
MNKSLNAIFTLFVVLFFVSLSVFAGNTDNSLPLPAHITNKIQLQIQREMSFTTKSETATTLWTPHTMTLQKWEASPSPALNPYAPNEVNYLLTYDVGMGHNMEGATMYWRQCDVLVNVIDGTWGEPALDCDKR